jgi:meiotically up-regulated gene 157 (Mug157) protein
MRGIMRGIMRDIMRGIMRDIMRGIMQDPWANAYNPKFKEVTDLPKFERQLGEQQLCLRGLRGSWVGSSTA